MRFWANAKGGRWCVDLNVATVRKVHRETSFHLGKMIEPEEIVKLQDNDFLLADILWSIHSEEAKSRNVTREQFEESLSGQSISDAFDAVMYGMTDFLSDRRKAEIFRQVLDQIKQVNAIRMEAAEKLLEVSDGLISIERSQETQAT